MTPEREQYIREWAKSKSEPLACRAMSELLETIDELRSNRRIVAGPGATEIIAAAPDGKVIQLP
jgi:hypothetical protein